jgi:hypothetical protein
MYQNAVLLLAICLAAAIVCLRGARIKAAVGVVLVGLAAALSLALYLPSIAAAHDWGVIVRSPVSTQRLLDVLGQALGCGSVATVWLWSGLAILSCWVAIRALLSRKRQPAARAKSDLALFCATVLVSAGAMYFMALKASQLYVMPWYYVPLAVIVAPALDATAWLISTTDRWRIIRLAVVLAIACTMAIPGWRQSHERWTNIDVVASKIGEHAVAGDVVVLNPFWLGITFQRYYKGPAKLVTIPPLEDVRIARYDLVKAAMARPGALDPALEAIAKALQSGHHVWWVAGIPLGPHKTPTVLPPAPLPDSGWDIGPYLFGWARQAAYFLESHCLQADQVDVRVSGLVADYENVVLMSVSGWH